MMPESTIEEEEAPLSPTPTTGLPVPPNLDHLIHLVPPGKLEEAIQQFQRLGFAVEHGGVHADSLTHNALIVLTDGVYLELIAFLEGPLKKGKEKAEGGKSRKENEKEKDQSQQQEKQETKEEWLRRREKHWWWGKKTGWIDWCLLGGVDDGRVASINERVKRAEDAERQHKKAAETKDDSENPSAGEQQQHHHSGVDEHSAFMQPLWATAAAFGAPTDHRRQAIEARMQAQPPLIQYEAPKEGGRLALSGRKIKWQVTFPQGGVHERGAVPFWCQDETPRFWRVPLPSPHHPNKTQGLTALTLLYHPETFSSRLSSLRLVLNNIPPASQTSSDPGQEGVGGDSALLTVPPPLVDGTQPAIPPEPVTLLVGTPKGPPLSVRVKAAEDPEELSWLDKFGEGLFEVEISVAPEMLPASAPPDGIERETHAKGYGRLRLHPIMRH